MQNGRRVRRGRGEVLGFKAEAGTVAFLGSFDAFAYQSIMQSYQPGEFRDARAEDLALILERRPQLAGREISLGRLQSESEMFLRR